MIGAHLVAVLWVTATPAPANAAEEAYRAGAALFEQGQLERAIKRLDDAAERATEDLLLGQILLLRGRCSAALNDSKGAEVSFAEALRHDPTLALDPTRVLPSVVGILERVKGQLRATLVVTTRPSGIVLLIDGRPLGASPFEGVVGIGRHRIEAQWPADAGLAKEVILHPGERLALALDAPPSRPPPTPPEPRWLRPMVDLRLLVDPLAGVGADLAAGLRSEHWTASASVLAGARVGLSVRLGGRLPLGHRVGLQGSLDGLLFFRQPVLPGLGASAGAFVWLRDWIEPFAELAYRHLATSGQYRTDYLLAVAGARLSLP